MDDSSAFSEDLLLPPFPLSSAEPPKAVELSIISTSVSLDHLLEKALDKIHSEDGTVNDPEGRDTGEFFQPKPTPLSKAPGGVNRSHRRRARKREEDIVKKGHVRRLDVLGKILEKCKEINAGGNLATLGSPSKPLSSGLKLVPWNGINPLVIKDNKNRIGALLAGRCSAEGFVEACENLCNLILAEGALAQFSKLERQSGRGQFPAINFGVFHGKGTPAPLNLDNKKHDAMICRLRGSKELQRVAAFASSTFALWNPGVYGYYLEHLNPLFERFPHLEKIFMKSVFPTAAINFGPRVCTKKHRDLLNCPFGWCAIQSLGRFNPLAGGHIVLWEFGLIIQFPPNSLIFIPSATVTHSNRPVSKDETRISFTQYCPGALLRYVENGFRTERLFRLEDAAGYGEMCKKKTFRLADGLSLIPKLEDLRQELP